MTRSFDGTEKHFCCPGCARVYEVARENDLLEQVRAKPNPRPPVLLPTSKTETAYFDLGGMWCAGCATAAEHVLRHQSGIHAADVSFAAERGRIRYDPRAIDPTLALSSLQKLGYRARLETGSGETHQERQQDRTLRQLIVAVAFGMQVMLLYLVQLYPLYAAGQFDTPEVRRMQLFVWALATPVLLWGGSSFLRGAWRALRARTATMDTLVALGTLSAYGYSVYIALTGTGEVYFDSVAMITTFIMVGRYLEALGGAQARKDIRELLTLQPDVAQKRVEGEWQQTQARALTVGDTILVKPGERVPADAEIVEGEGAIDESLLTGESMPVEKNVGDLIYAGTVVSDAALIARVARPVRDTRLAQITSLVNETLSAKPPIQRLADKASAYFALGILAVAALTGAAWVLTGRVPAQAVLAAVAVLVVACPCALGLATPLALTVTLGRTTQSGILVRNPTALETAAQVRRIVLDKTGTLTMGRMAVVDTVVDGHARMGPHDLLALAAAVEQYAEHPIARAIVAAAAAPALDASDAHYARGQGASARVDGRRIAVGSAQFVGFDPTAPLAGEADEHARRGDTVVWVGDEGRVVGFIALRDTANPTAEEAVRQLAAAQVHPVMLSGDDPRATEAVALELGLADWEGHCPPAEKALRIAAWQADGVQTAMVGDGVNDAPALAQADLSITTAGGTDVAGETSDIVLTRADLTAIPWLIALSRRTRRIILQNLGWAFAYNLVAVPLAALGVIRPVIAALSMATSSLLVVGNSLRLHRKGLP